MLLFILRKSVIVEKQKKSSAYYFVAQLYGHWSATYTSRRTHCLRTYVSRLANSSLHANLVKNCPAKSEFPSVSAVALCQVKWRSSALFTEMDTAPNIFYKR